MITKYRVWDTFHNKWVKHFYITENGLIYDMGRQHRNLIGAVPIEKSGLIVMQSTGKKDCNNSDIFDADIVLEPWTGRIIGRVFYSSEDLAWKVLRVGVGEEYLSDYLDLQVCGNIYENPDLMEEFEE
ncbi:YopX family protein [Streptococcus pluranimalium]|uniref:YopX family protein n=1 Tax=Streptococcus pluranimalium TaxID=82348 RepID=UPI0039FBE623